MLCETLGCCFVIGQIEGFEAADCPNFKGVLYPDQVKSFTLWFHRGTYIV